jgi:hypothetical protein
MMLFCQLLMMIAIVEKKKRTGNSWRQKGESGAIFRTGYCHIYIQLFFTVC